MWEIDWLTESICLPKVDYSLAVNLSAASLLVFNQHSITQRKMGVQQIFRICVRPRAAISVGISEREHRNTTSATAILSLGRTGEDDLRFWDLSATVLIWVPSCFRLVCFTWPVSNHTTRYSPVSYHSWRVPASQYGERNTEVRIRWRWTCAMSQLTVQTTAVRAT